MFIKKIFCEKKIYEDQFLIIFGVVQNSVFPYKRQTRFTQLYPEFGGTWKMHFKVDMETALQVRSTIVAKGNTATMGNAGDGQHAGDGQ